MTPSFWSSLPGIITALGSVVTVIGTFFLSQQKSNHEEQQALYGRMKQERDESYTKWKKSESENMKLKSENLELKKELNRYENNN
ncbi:hypothetical protein [Lactiplantibacillus daowaiensis]|uniref:Uncharacterized protein n=1 Tax=Lactiplantibacillus daowaiensis TaxID=2559918 RepID=A0ABW1RYY7_9LACO|nr:hypothetical protein [Lactiplantibacillus daowaiensis]